MLAVLSTSAASGSSTIAPRKKVAKPSVRPKPGSTLGWRKLLMPCSACAQVRNGATPSRRLPDRSLQALRQLRARTLPFRILATRSMDDEDRTTRRAREQTLEAVRHGARILRAEDEHRRIVVFLL